MKYALVIYENPTSSGREAELAWINATQGAKDKISKSIRVSVLNDGCFLCDLSNGLHDLRWIVAAAEDYGLQSRALFFEKEPPFVITPKNP